MSKSLAQCCSQTWDFARSGPLMRVASILPSGEIARRFYDRSSFIVSNDGTDLLIFHVRCAPEMPAGVDGWGEA